MNGRRQAGPQTRAAPGRGRQAVEASSAAPTTGGTSRRATRAAGATAWTPSSMRRESRRRRRRNAAAEHDVDVAARESQPAHGRHDHGDELVGLPVDDALRDGVALPCRHEHRRRELGRVLVGRGRSERPAARRHAAQAEVRGTSAFEHGVRSAAVPAADRGAYGLPAQPAAAAVVTRDLAQCGEAHVRPFGATAGQFMPAPQTRPTPQPRSVPARSTAKVSLRTTSARRERAAAGRARCGGRRPAGRRRRDRGPPRRASGRRVGVEAGFVAARPRPREQGRDRAVLASPARRGAAAASGAQQDAVGRHQARRLSSSRRRRRGCRGRPVIARQLIQAHQLGVGGRRSAIRRGRAASGHVGPAMEQHAAAPSPKGAPASARPGRRPRATSTRRRSALGRASRTGRRPRRRSHSPGSASTASTWSSSSPSPYGQRNQGRAVDAGARGDGRFGAGGRCRGCRHRSSGQAAHDDMNGCRSDDRRRRCGGRAPGTRLAHRPCTKNVAGTAAAASGSSSRPGLSAGRMPALLGIDRQCYAHAAAPSVRASAPPLGRQSIRKVS